ncbi:S8/S53 family peptidase [Planctomonas sp. JC2975]|uniref:S53 family peptidase n=1 Tax=Planctomonas sp. JC2975 TaxID=2729626 RepID=UPI0014760AFC|nr:S53 family peptidase [Planctomonas sp. JC2975]NNC11409.1 S8/S53 family peptidase [Planctomonas sp. JC2975]
MTRDENPTNDDQRPGSTPANELPGSERAPLGSATTTGPVPDDETIEATIVLRRREPVPDEVLVNPIPRDEFVQRYGADPTDVDAVVAEAESAGAEVLSVDAGERRIRIRAKASVVHDLFGASLETAEHEPRSGGTVRFRQRTGTLALPEGMQGRVVAVLGLDDRPQATAHFVSIASAAVAVSYTPPQVGAVYKFPQGTDGTGRTIAIIELGGGFDQSDLDTYFAGLGIPTPSVTAVGVDGAANVPGGDPNGADGEVLLDIEVIGALAPAANILVYFAPNTDAGFVDAVTSAAHADPTPDAISISWGESEDAWTAQARQAFDDALVDAAGLGVTVTAAAGDDGSSDRVTDGKPHVDFPASSPHILACGGTSLNANAATGHVTSEVVWNNGSGRGATGGGVSDAFGVPSWQATVGVPKTSSGFAGRGVPDVAGDADPQTGYKVRVDGTDTVIGGTSAVAPLWAALAARLVQATGSRVGLLPMRLYTGATATATAAGLRDIVTGNNGAYAARAGWDACTGLGVPDGDALVATLRATAG